MNADYDEVLRSLGLEPSGGTRRQQAACGTYAGYFRHTDRCEEPCQPCRKANAEYKRKREAAPKDPATLPPINHGTPQGARQHWYRGDSPCDDCHSAYYAWKNPLQRERRRRQRAARQEVSQ